MLIISLQDEQAGDISADPAKVHTRCCAEAPAGSDGERCSRNGHLAVESLTFSAWHVCSDMGDRALTCTRSSCPRRIAETRTEPLNQALYKGRNYVERAIHRLKLFRRVATRYEKRAQLPGDGHAGLSPGLALMCKQALVNCM